MSNEHELDELHINIKEDSKKSDSSSKDDPNREEMRCIREAVREGQWWKLTAYLTPAEIESLCGCSPVNLLGDYEPR